MASPTARGERCAIPKNPNQCTVDLLVSGSAFSVDCVVAMLLPSRSVDATVLKDFANPGTGS